MAHSKQDTTKVCMFLGSEIPGSTNYACSNGELSKKGEKICYTNGLGGTGVCDKYIEKGTHAAKSAATCSFK